MLTIQCSQCLATLEEPGALTFSPPNQFGQCQKLHWCVKCWNSGNGIPVKMARGIGASSWLHDQQFQWFRDAYAYASTQTQAIPGLSDVSPEDLYYIVQAFLHQMGTPK